MPVIVLVIATAKFDPCSQGQPFGGIVISALYFQPRSKKLALKLVLFTVARRGQLLGVIDDSVI
jgi:hypothetical protein